MHLMPTIKVKDIASILKISTHSIYKVIKDHQIPVIAQGNKKVLPPESVRKILELRGFDFRPKNKPLIISASGMKGGIGKTSLATAIAEGSSRLGFRTLGIDLDMQGNLTQSFRMKKHGAPVLLHAINETKKLNEIIVNVHPCLDLIPSNLENSQIEIVLGNQTLNYTGYFNSLFSEIHENYDLIIMDCAPTISKLTSCATCYADINLIPINADYDSFDGVVMSVSEIKRLEKTFSDRNLRIDYSILFNKYDAREKLSHLIMGEITSQSALRTHLLPIVIRTDTAFKNTKADGIHIFDIPKSSGKEDCYSLIAEMTGINGWISGNQASAEVIDDQIQTPEKHTFA